MKTTLNAKSARTAVKFVSGVIGRKTVLPILSNVHCTANGHFEITGTDLDVTLRAQCDCRSSIDGAITLPSSALVDACAGNADFELETGDKNTIAIRTGGNSRNVFTLPIEEFPPLVIVPPDARTLAFPAAQFLSALKSVSLAQSTDESRYVLNGVCVDMRPDGVRLVATDGRRLHLAQLSQSVGNAAEQEKINAVQLAVHMAEQDLAAAKELYPPTYEPAEMPHKGYFKQVAAKEIGEAAEILERAQGILSKMTAAVQIILPAKAVKHILRLPIDKKAPGEITLQHFAECAVICAGNYRIVTKLIEGNYPCYQQVIPSESKESIDVNVSEFCAAIEFAEKATSDKSNSVRITIAGNTMTVMGKTPEVGEATAQCGVARIMPPGKDLVIAMNPAYVLSACESFSGGETMTLELIDELSPLKITNGAGLTAVIMPMRLS